MPYGYLTDAGYRGLVEGTYILFATEEEYYEYLSACENESEKENSL